MALNASSRIRDSAVAGLVQVASTDVEEHCASLGRWRLNYDQISAGAFAGSFTLLTLPRLDVFREVTSQQVRQYGQLGAGSFGIGLAWQGDGTVSCNGASSMARNEIIACIDAEVDLCTPRAFELRGIVTSVALIQELAGQLQIDLPRWFWHQLAAIEMAEAPVARLRTLLAAIHDTVTLAPERLDDVSARQALEDALLVDIMDMLPTARASDSGRGAAARKRTVDRARDLMHDSAERTLSLLEICKAVGASPRKLGYCFQEVVGTSPMHYWRAMRLNRVRRALKRGDQNSIYDVAVQHGFWHFSQFSLDYKRHFAELPSETLRRARRAA